MPKLRQRQQLPFFDAFNNLQRGHYGAILVDPPVPFTTWSSKGEGRSPQHHYPCMSFDELAALPVASLARADCFLLLWIPLRSIAWVEPLMDAWRFDYSGSAFAWVKQNRSGVGWFMGGGYSTRKNIEVCWLGRRGKPKRKSAAVRELIVAPVREHSRKPDEVLSRIEALCDGPYVELFARQSRAGWDSWGDQATKFDHEIARQPLQARDRFDDAQHNQGIKHHDT
jgi:N6-adenosine-specific RNA methylase IME4